MAQSHLLRELFKWQDDQELTDKQLAMRLGVSWATVSRLKHGQRKVGPEVQRAILREVPALVGYLVLPEEPAAVEAVAG